MLENLNVRTSFELVLRKEKVEYDLGAHVHDLFVEGSCLRGSDVLLHLLKRALIAFFFTVEPSFHFEELFGG